MKEISILSLYKVGKVNIVDQTFDVNFANQITTLLV